MKTHNSELGMAGDHDHTTKSYYYMIFHIISMGQYFSTRVGLRQTTPCELKF